MSHGHAPEEDPEPPAAPPEPVFFGTNVVGVFVDSVTLRLYARRPRFNPQAPVQPVENGEYHPRLNPEEAARLGQDILTIQARYDAQ